MRAVSDALPGHLDLAPDEVRPLLAGLTDAPLDLAVRLTPEPDLTDTPADLLLANGRSAFERPGAARYASTGQLAADDALRQAAVLRGADRFSDAHAQELLDRFAASGRELGVDQAAVLRGRADLRRARRCCAPPRAPASRSSSAPCPTPGRTAAREVCFGLAPSQVAAAVLAEEASPPRRTRRRGWVLSVV